MIRYTKKEEIWNASSHGGGILLGVVFGIIFLVWCFKSDNDWARVGVILYLFGMLGSYVASTLYHSVKHHSKWKERLRKWDHAAIGLLGLEPFYLRVDLCAGGYDSQFYQTEGALQLGDVLLHRYGAERACGL